MKFYEGNKYKKPYWKIFSIVFRSYV